MTRTMYGAKVTEIIDSLTGGDFEYPDSFELDIDSCFTRRLSPEEAAEELARQYGLAGDDE